MVFALVYEGLEFEQRQSGLKNPDGSGASAVLAAFVRSLALPSFLSSLASPSFLNALFGDVHPLPNTDILARR